MQNNRLGRLLKHKRVAMLVTLEELAMASGVSEVDLEQIESSECVPQNGAWSGLPMRLASRRASY